MPRLLEGRSRRRISSTAPIRRRGEPSLEVPPGGDSGRPEIRFLLVHDGRGSVELGGIRVPQAGEGADFVVLLLLLCPRPPPRLPPPASPPNSSPDRIAQEAVDHILNNSSNFPFLQRLCICESNFDGEVIRIRHSKLQCLDFTPPVRRAQDRAPPRSASCQIQGRWKLCQVG
ncbi:unnamed protein product [Linum trigynum]|uniref:Uncharacterized protein n=1 Tax=Linum trigynum TaxID=586398 RepID=A0AAV2D3C4_9ROSI